MKLVGLHFVTIKCHQPAAASVPAWQRAARSSLLLGPPGAPGPRPPHQPPRLSSLSSLLSFTPSLSFSCNQGALTPPLSLPVSLRSSSGHYWLSIVSAVQWEAQSSVGKAARRQKTHQTSALLAAVSKLSAQQKEMGLGFQCRSITSLNNTAADCVCMCIWGAGGGLRRLLHLSGVSKHEPPVASKQFCRPSALTAC